jgi:hypothetical protein
VVPLLQQLFAVRGGSRVKGNLVPAKHIELVNLDLTDARISYLEAHGVPSGGDWALQRNAAVWVEGVENFTLHGNRFRFVDGNAFMAYGYARETYVVKNVFEHIGDSAMAAWGEVDELNGEGDGVWRGPVNLRRKKFGADWWRNSLVDHDSSSSPRSPQPWRTYVVQNVALNVGYYQKQSSMWFQAKAAQTLLFQNVFFDGPRAGVNFNDNFGGGNEVSENVIFNQCKETSDHGPINSWDRVPFRYDTRLLRRNTSSTDTTSWVPAHSFAERNLILANFRSLAGFDHDDGSSRWTLQMNYFADSGGLKMDYGGHSKVFRQNIFVRFAKKPSNASIYANTNPCVQIDGHPAYYLSSKLADVYEENLCISLPGSTGAPYGSTVLQITEGCTYLEDENGAATIQDLNFHVGNNRYFTPDGRARVQCGEKEVDIESEWFASGAEQHSVVGDVHDLGTDYGFAVVISEARKLLMQVAHDSDARRDDVLVAL